MEPGSVSCAQWPASRNRIPKHRPVVYELVKGITAVAAIAGLVFIAREAERAGIDGSLFATIVVLVGALGGIYLSDVARKLNGR